MQRLLTVLCTAAAVCGGVQYSSAATPPPQPATSHARSISDLRLPDPATLDALKAQLTDIEQPATLLSAPLAASATTSRRSRLTGANADFAEELQQLNIHPLLLGMPSANGTVAGQPASGMGVPRNLARLSLQIDGNEYQLWVVDVVVDPVSGYRHVTAAVLNIPNASALFTISADQKVAGTLTTGRESYRILPNPDAGQTVYRVRSNAVRAGKDLALLTHDMSRAVRDLQRRHLQALKAAELQFEFVLARRAGDMLGARGGRLGQLNTRTATEAQLSSVLRRLGELSNAATYGGIAIVDRSDRHVRFQQRINGFAVEGNNEITTAADGSIDEIRIVTFDPTTAPSGEVLVADRAIVRAADTYARYVGRPGAEVEVLSTAEPRYRRIPDQHGLELVYTFGVRIAGQSYSAAVVNALTGEVRIEDRVERLSWISGRRIFVTTSGAPATGSDPGATLAWDDNLADDTAGDQCKLPDYCFSPPDLMNLQTTTYELRLIWESTVHPVDPTLCCDLFGGSDHKLDYVIGTTGGSTIAEYNPLTKTVLFEPPTGLSTESWASNADTVIHETFHHLEDVMGMENDDFSKVLKEGLSDAMVGAVAEWRDPPWLDNMQQGSKWIIGDGRAGLPNGFRDASQPRQLSHIANTLANVANPDRFHWASLAVSNFFYRLVQKGAISDARHIEYIMKIPRWLNDWNQSGAIDLDDYFHALYNSARPNETTLRAKIVEVWQEMGGTVPPSGGDPNGPGGGGGGTPPAAPINVDGAFYTCSNGYAWHSVSWTPMPNVGHYRTYVGPFEDIAPGYLTSGYAWSNFNTEFRVRSCNGAGCSAASIDSYVMNYSGYCGM